MKLLVIVWPSCGWHSLTIMAQEDSYFESCKGAIPSQMALFIYLYTCIYIGIKPNIPKQMNQMGYCVDSLKVLVMLALSTFFLCAK